MTQPESLQIAPEAMEVSERIHKAFGVSPRPVTEADYAEIGRLTVELFGTFEKIQSLSLGVRSGKVWEPTGVSERHP